MALCTLEALHKEEEDEEEVREEEEEGRRHSMHLLCCGWEIITAVSPNRQGKATSSSTLRKKES